MSQLFGLRMAMGVAGGGIGGAMDQSSIMRLDGSASPHIIQLDFHSSHLGFSEARQPEDGVMEPSSS